MGRRRKKAMSLRARREVIEVECRGDRDLHRPIPAVRRQGFHLHGSIPRPRGVRIHKDAVDYEAMKRIVIVTAGTRGDVQPYVALGQALRAAGYRVRILTHPDFAPMVRGAGLSFASLGFAIRPLLEQPEGEAWLRRAHHPFALVQGILKAFLERAETVMPHILEGCADADMVVFSGLGFPAYHVAEARKIPAVAAYLQPLTPTRAFPAPIGPYPRWPRFGAAHWLSYRLAEMLSWWTVRRPSNRLRRRLGLRPLDLRGPFPAIRTGRVLHLYAFSAHVVPRPPDWPAWAHITGYWFRDPPAYTPPASLEAFLEAHRPVVYVGFGSLRLPDPERVWKTLTATLEALNLHAVVARGWSHLAPDRHPRVYRVDEVPHEWLFPRVDAVIHHGGAGTTATGLRYGIPTLVVPFLADQFFWAERIARLGAGLALRGFQDLDTPRFREALQALLSTPSFRVKARRLAHAIQAEKGIPTAVRWLHARVGG